MDKKLEIRGTCCYRFMIQRSRVNSRALKGPTKQKLKLDMADAMDVKAGLEALIQAAQFLEENGANSTGAEVDIHTSDSRKRLARHRIKKPSPYSRTTHNLLEKNRRAQLRDCLEVLRQHVPFPDKLTTLALLQSARKYIEALKQKEKEEGHLLSELQRTQTILLTRLAELGAGSQLLPALSAFTASHSTSNNSLSIDSQSSITPSDQTQTANNGTSTREEDDNTVIDVIHDSEDDTSSTTSGSDGGCTSTSHKNNSTYEYH